MNPWRRAPAVFVLTLAALASIATKTVQPTPPGVAFVLEEAVRLRPAAPEVVEVTFDAAWSEDASAEATIVGAWLEVEVGFTEEIPRGVRVAAVDLHGVERTLQPGESGLSLATEADCGPDACTASVLITFYREGVRRPPGPRARDVTVDLRAYAHAEIGAFTDEADLVGEITLTRP